MVEKKLLEQNIKQLLQKALNVAQINLLHIYIINQVLVEIL